jgi:MFS family permease
MRHTRTQHIVPSRKASRWLNRTVLGIGLASLFSDWSHEIATTVMPAFLASMGMAAAWLGLIEGIADGFSSFAKMASGFYTDRLKKRKQIAVWGYLVTAVGTGAIGSASAAWHVLIARSAAWIGRGARTPVRKALLAASVDSKTYGRAFGFERMMDTLGAILGPSSALILLQITNQRYPRLFVFTLIPGLLAALVIVFFVQEKERAPVVHESFGVSLKALPPAFKKYLIAVGLFGAGDFAHTLLILFAAQKLTPILGAGNAASAAAGLYILHNTLYAAFSFISGILADKFDKRRLLAGGYFLAAIMAVIVIFMQPTLPTIALVFVLGGIYVAVEETLEDSLCAEIVGEAQHGMAFGTLATVNGVGDFASSVIVGLLWTTLGTSIAFGYSAVLFMAGGVLVARLKLSEIKPIESV